MAGVLDRFRLDGRTALVTGGGTGIGEAVARALGEAGARLVLAGRRQAPLDEAVARLSRAGIPACGIAVDVTDRQALKRLAEAALAWSAIDVLVNAAGVNLRQPFTEVTPEAWDTPGRADVQDEIEHWCFACRTQYPHEDA